MATQVRCEQLGPQPRAVVFERFVRAVEPPKVIQYARLFLETDVTDHNNERRRVFTAAIAAMTRQLREQGFASELIMRGGRSAMRAIQPQVDEAGADATFAALIGGQEWELGDIALHFSLADAHALLRPIADGDIVQIVTWGIDDAARAGSLIATAAATLDGLVDVL
jgi:hypothetical protein